MCRRHEVILQSESHISLSYLYYAYFLQVVLDSQPWLHEPSLVELPWKPVQKVQKPLKIGMVYHDGIVQPHPPITRSLQQVATTLEAAGHTIIPWGTSLHEPLIECLKKFYFLDGGKEYHDILSVGEEPASPLMKWLLDGAPATSLTVSETWKVG